MEMKVRSTIMMMMMGAACVLWGARSAQSQSTNPQVEAGKKIFESKGLCSTCHSREKDKIIVGPSLSGIASRVDKAFFTQQLTDPQKNFKNTSFFKTKKSQVSVMPKPSLTEQERNTVIDYLLTLK